MHTLSYKFDSILTSDDCYYYKTDNHNILALIGKELFTLNQSQPIDHGTYISTSTSITKMAATLAWFGIDSGSEYYYTDAFVKKSLKNGDIFLISGKDARSSLETSRHSWIIDGCVYCRWWSGEYVKLKGKDWELTNDHGISSYMLIHMNWGYNGNGNGLYTSGVFDSDKVYQLDNKNLEAIGRYYYNNITIIPFYI